MSNYQTFTAGLGEVRAPDPSESSSFISRVFFLWVGPLLRKGRQRPLQSEDCWELVKRRRCRASTKQVAQNWLEGSSLVRALVKTFGLQYLLVGFYLLLAVLLESVGPLFLNRLVTLLAQASSESYTGSGSAHNDHDAPHPVSFMDSRIWLCVVCLFATRFMRGLFFGQYYFQSEMLVLRVAAAGKGLLFRKAMRLSARSRRRCGTSVMVNHYTVDVKSVARACMSVHSLVIAPLAIAVVLSMLYAEVGVACLAGLIIIFVALGLTHFIAVRKGRVFEQLMERKDRRLQSVRELFAAILPIKLRAWEGRFAAKILDQREKELESCWGHAQLTAATVFLFWMAPVLVSGSTFSLMMLGAGPKLTAASAFTALSLFQLLQTPLRRLPDEINQVIMARTALQRIDKFLKLEDRDPGNVLGPEDLPSVPTSLRICIQNGHFGWIEEEEEEKEEEEGTEAGMNSKSEGEAGVSTKPAPAAPVQGPAKHEQWSVREVLQNVDLEVTERELVLVGGPVASGKTTLLCAIMGDAIRLQGGVYVGGSIAYVSQSPWIENATVRDNITFGEPFSRQRYDKVVKACALEEDFASFEGGDMALTGENGTSLSGGQRARVALARACYSRASILLLDAPLAALDPIVSKHVFENCIMGLLRQRTVLMSTHNLGLANKYHVDKVFEISATGCLAKVRREGLKVEDELEPKPSIQLPKQRRPRIKESQIVRLPSSSPIDTQKQASTQPQQIPRPARHKVSEYAVDLSSHTSSSLLSPRNSGQAFASFSKSLLLSPCSPSALRSSHLHRADPSAVADFIRPSAGLYVMDSSKSAHTNSLDESRQSPGRPRELASLTSPNATASVVAQSTGDPSPPCAPRTVDEERATGRVDLRVVQRYFQAGGGLFAFSLLLGSQILWQLLVRSSDWWLNIWSSNPDGAPMRSLGLYLALSLGSVAALGCRTMIVASLGLRASRVLFQDMLHALTAAKMEFFNENPLGRILNRMADDVGTIDLWFGWTVGTVFTIGVSVLGMLLVSVAVIPSLLLFLVPLTGVYLYTTHYYLCTSREVERLQKISLSPSLDFVSSALEGTLTIRAFGPDKVKYFQRRNEELVDETSRWQVAFSATIEWFCLRMQIIGSVLVLCVTSLLAASSGSIGAGLAGLATTYALTLDQDLEGLVLTWADMENEMVSPERVQQYIDLPAEEEEVKKNASQTQEKTRTMAEEDEPLLVPQRHSHSEEGSIGKRRTGGTERHKSEREFSYSNFLPDWPSRGKVEFKHVFLLYPGQSSPALKDLNLKLPGGSKVAVVGRTGSGKTSLAMALFRLYELRTGHILIDGRDISLLPLHVLRSRLSIVSQLPVVAGGSLRDFLDPFRELPDHELWGALEEVGLKAKVGAWTCGLESPLAEGGGNLSAGEAQLVTLAAALLRPSPLLVLDEATAAMDGDSERRLQQVVRRRFSASTVISIVHRLQAVADADLVVVMEAGRICQVGSPRELMQDTEGRFYSLATEARAKHESDELQDTLTVRPEDKNAHAKATATTELAENDV